jgi:hypothetical protein
MDFEELKKHINKVMHEQNNRGIPDFEGYSPSEMNQIINFTFHSNCPIQLQKLTDSECKRIPIFNQIKYLADLIVENGEIKLTAKGYLPTKIVSDIYKQGFMKEEFIESGILKLYKETDSKTINLTRILILLSGLAKKRNGKLSLTKSANKILSDNNELLRFIFLTFAAKFNWAYCDRYGDNMIGQLGYGFSLILISKYGKEKHLDSFYAAKYFKAFPKLLESIEPSYDNLESYAVSCYSLRTFERFLDYFGLISINEEGKWPETKKFIIKTELFDKLIKCAPHTPTKG